MVRILEWSIITDGGGGDSLKCSVMVKKKITAPLKCIENYSRPTLEHMNNFRAPYHASCHSIDVHILGKYPK